MLNYRDLDWKLIGAAMALTLIGVLLVYSAEHASDSAYARTFYMRQMVWFGIALVAFAVVIHLPPRLLELGAYFIFGVGLLLLALVLVAGTDRLGARRWFDFGPVSFSPSDLAKIGLLLALARFSAYTRLPITSFRRFALTAVMAIIPTALIMKQPDLGSSLVLLVIVGAFWFWSGLPWFYLFLIVSPIISLITAWSVVTWLIYILIVLAVLFFTRPGLSMGVFAMVTNLAFGILTPILWNRLHDYQQMRIITFLDPGRDPRGAGYQIIQSKIAIGSGGLVGKGFLEGSQSRLDFLPERHTDFIFSILGEEFGLIGGIVVLALFGVIFVQSIRTAVKCRSPFLSYLSFGAMAILLFQVLVNAGMTLGLMPVTGLPMPFVSYGGTSLVLMWTLVGIICLCNYHWQEY
jgi:rod shape determining protein RodA